MKVVDHCEKAPRQIDYPQLAKTYNDMAISQSVEMAKVYNITMFKVALRRRGLTDEDFTANNCKGKCYVTKLTDTPMQRI